MRHSVASAPAVADDAQFAVDVARGLSQAPRRLPPQYFYDALGSALFESICRLPWYGITRTELRLLAAHAGEIAHLASPLADLVELGPGSGEKLSTFVRSARGLTPKAHVHLVDLSASALDAAAHRLGMHRGLDVRTYHAEYQAGLATAMAERQAADANPFALRGLALVLFLGSNIGNFDPPEAAELLTSICERLGPGDSLLVGIDLVRPERELLLAYDDPLGVTAAFNRNLLLRINRELGGDFDETQFQHRAMWNARASRVEMHLVSLRCQTVRVPAAGVTTTFAAGETIWTENSYKYEPAAVVALLADAGFDAIGRWIDEGFMLVLARPSDEAAPREPRR